MSLTKGGGAGGGGRGVAEVNVVFDGMGGPLPAGAIIPWMMGSHGTLKEVVLLADRPGNIVLDIWKGDYGIYPLGAGQSITAADKPTLAAAQKYRDQALTGWTTKFATEDVFVAHIDSTDTLTLVTLCLRFFRTGL